MNITLHRKMKAAVVVAHPDDEVLWCGGYILAHPELHWRIVTLCRASDSERASRFRRVLTQVGAQGEMADLDDGPDQTPMLFEQVQTTVANLLAGETYGLVLTHGPQGEYTRHRRHEECSRAVVSLWRHSRLHTRQLWMFAYEDGGRAHLPRVRGDADLRHILSETIWKEKKRLMTEFYGFDAESWEARTTPKEEGFWCFETPQAAMKRAAPWGNRS